MPAPMCRGIKHPIPPALPRPGVVYLLSRLRVQEERRELGNRTVYSTQDLFVVLRLQEVLNYERVSECVTTVKR